MQSTVVAAAIGIASGQREVVSTIVNETPGCWKVAFQVHVDVPEPACCHQYVLWWYLYVMVDGFLARWQCRQALA